MTDLADLSGSKIGQKQKISAFAMGVKVGLSEHSYTPTIRNDHLPFANEMLIVLNIGGV